MVSVKRSFSPAFRPRFVVWSNRKGCHGKVIKTDYGPSNREGTLIPFFCPWVVDFPLWFSSDKKPQFSIKAEELRGEDECRALLAKHIPPDLQRLKIFERMFLRWVTKSPKNDPGNLWNRDQVEHTRWDLYENQFSSEIVRIPQSDIVIWAHAMSALAPTGLVQITSWYPEINGSHFGLPLSSIHKMAGLGGKMVWIMMYSYRPHCCWSVFLCLVDLKTSEWKKIW